MTTTSLTKRLGASLAAVALTGAVAAPSSMAQQSGGAPTTTKQCRTLLKSHVKFAKKEAIAFAKKNKKDKAALAKLTAELNKLTAEQAALEAEMDALDAAYTVLSEADTSNMSDEERDARSAKMEEISAKMEEVSTKEDAAREDLEAATQEHADAKYTYDAAVKTHKETQAGTKGAIKMVTKHCKKKGLI